MKQRVILSAILIIVFLVGSGALAVLLIQSRPIPERIDRQPIPMLVETIEVQPRTVTESISGFGTARPELYATLSAEVPGKVIDLPDTLKAGVDVKKGEILLRIDPEEYQQQYTRAQSALDALLEQLNRFNIEENNLIRLSEVAQNEYDIASREHQRMQDLFDKNLAAKRERDLAMMAEDARRRTLLEVTNRMELLPSQRAELKAMLGNSRAELELAKLNLERCEVKAPFNGIVEQVVIEQGEYAMPGMVLLVMLDPDQIDVAIELPVAVRSRVHKGAECKLHVASMPDTQWVGVVERIAPSAAAGTRTFSVYIEVDNTQQQAQLVPGFFVWAEIAGATYTDVTVLPRGVIQNGRVYLCKKGKAKPADVEVQRHLREESIVTGLSNGDYVITSNLDMMRDELPVSMGDDAAENDETTSDDSGVSK